MCNYIHFKTSLKTFLLGMYLKVYKKVILTDWIKKIATLHTKIFLFYGEGLC